MSRIKLKDDSTRINACGFHWVPIDKLKTLGISQLRCYIASQWIWREKGIRTNPTWQANGFYDDYFKKMKDSGMQVIPCINQSPDWFLQGYDKNHPHYWEIKPIRFGSDPLKPESYREFGEMWWQFIARYGSNTYDDSLLRVQTEGRWIGDENVKKSGLDLIKYVEIWNEPDGWWREAIAKFTPEEYACMLSVCYDGHEGRFPNCGVKQADNTIKVLMGGLSNFNTDYLTGMLNWFKANRTDKKFATDFINIHHYSNATHGPNYMPQQWTVGCSPEEDNLQLRLKKVIKWAKDNKLKQKIWYTEFGYDTNSSGPSWQKSPAFGGMTTEEVQGNWLTRIYLESIAAGIDNCFMFNAIDEPCAPNGGLWCSAGLMRGEQDSRKFEPKDSYNKVKKCIEKLKGYRFYKDLSYDNIRIHIYAGPNNYRMVFWMADRTDSKEFDFKGRKYIARQFPQYQNLEAKLTDKAPSDLIIS